MNVYLDWEQDSILVGTVEDVLGYGHGAGGAGTSVHSVLNDIVCSLLYSEEALDDGALSAKLTITMR